MKKIIISCLLVRCFILCLGNFDENAVFAADSDNPRDKIKARLKYEWQQQFDDIIASEVLTGNLIRMENGEAVRLIGVETPEIQDGNKIIFDSKLSGIPVEVLKTMGKEAVAFLKELVENKRVRVEFDKKERDNYGNLWGYVFLIPNKKKQNEVFINVEIVKKGYSCNFDTTPNLRYQKLFQQSSNQSKENCPKIWRQWQR